MDRLQAMACFVRVVETGSFSAAARQMRLGQPAVSKTVAQLEDWLGTRLLLRSTRQLVPTDAGWQFHEAAKRALTAAEEAEQAARSDGRMLRGRLRVCAAVTFARMHIVPHLGAFLERHPGVELDLQLDDGNIDLIEAGFDLALRMGSLADSSLTARRLGQGGRMPVATPAFIDRHGWPDGPADLAGLPAIIYTRANGGLDWTFRRGGERMPVTLEHCVLRTNAAEAMRAAVLADYGFAIGGTWLFKPELTAGTIKVLVPDWTLPAMDLWAVTPPGRQVNARTRAFIEFVADLVD